MSANGVTLVSKVCDNLTTSQNRSADEVDACPSRKRRQEANLPSTDPQIQDGRVYGEASKRDISLRCESSR
ncbi:hypothetical protein JTE90_005465 [Oedothorax gibbosus]|uniref:Uncharacterized protein n=1 Tax=Oedothorax gibbosus TaxID=931172 RepID=A0AAV6U656_9ARAC|nr:hypothetical protein JTE90_005465 [Oedothorax gibbosus]